MSLISSWILCCEKISTASLATLKKVITRQGHLPRNYPELHEEVEGALNGGSPLRDHSDLPEHSRPAYGATETNNFRVECLRLVNSYRRAACANNRPWLCLKKSNINVAARRSHAPGKGGE